MTDNPCNCSTCPEDYMLKYCPLGRHFNGKLNRFIPGTMSFPSKIVGCLSHPQAPEHLNADVIKELERQRNEAAEDTDDGSIGYVSGMDNAIALIRDGVKKE